MRSLDSRYQHKVVEEKCNSTWDADGIYRWKGDVAQSFVIDTPPPTVSGVLHMGHVFSYCHTDFIARYQRMSGKDVFYPIGFDDNGLPTERLVEKVRKLRAAQLDRAEFTQICREVSREFRVKFKDLFRQLGISYDWTLEYHTVSKEIQKLSQASFLDLYAKGQLYRKKKPILWDTVDCTAIAHAEIEERDLPSAMNTISFHTEDGERINIATTRPELIPACVAIFFNPEDDRYKHLHGKLAVVPVGGHKVRILPDSKVKIEKGTGLVMCCTFGDETDVHWWHTHRLDTRIIMDKTGSISSLAEDTPDSKIPAAQFDGMRVQEARNAVCDALKSAGLLISQEQIVHTVKCAERSGAPIEILLSDQWFVKVVEHKQDLLEQVQKVCWHPDSMRKRMEIWIENLNWDWCVSRQRYFGVPFPLWYSKRAGELGKVLFPRVEDLPVDPLQDLPSGYSKDEVEPEVDVMDTWATSSISPQFFTKSIGQTLRRDGGLTLPTDLRAQSHEIIRSWAFYTILKSYHHSGEIPWKNIMISGWCLADDKTKMSKSKGNAASPEKTLDLYGADAVRYWAAKSRLGADTVFSEETLKTGKRLTTKLWNASKFVSTFLHESFPVSSAEMPTDLWILSKLHKTIADSTESFKCLEYCTALNSVEEFFWKNFCDNYLELVKHRAYNHEPAREHASAISTLCHTLKTLLLLFAPFLPYVTDEIYNTLCTGCVHTQGWPDASTIPFNSALEQHGDVLVKIVEEVRKAKTQAQVSVKYPVETLTISGLAADFPEPMLEDLKHVCCTEHVMCTASDNAELRVSVSLAAPTNNA
ncbi:valine--tRNA ligase [Anaplasma capra]|uniref:valine--tRNA ligase n=1 Tax=Anaplasma capra TaxID=1562740 RepID=UPI0021D5E473|nr:valine--tRNA ligase [Anaplasma capra]MCU7611106.1 valine--tRNA ligase [Anaplasma capra]MCU7612390.1 valine--tRNA ligase [Anaplasma capra]